MAQPPHGQGSTWTDANGTAATMADIFIIRNVDTAARLLNRTAAAGRMNPTDIPTIPNATVKAAKGSTATFATMPAGVNMQNSWATIGAPETQAANDMPIPSSQPFFTHPGRYGRIQRNHTTIPNMTAKDKVQPTSKRREGLEP